LPLINQRSNKKLWRVLAMPRRSGNRVTALFAAVLLLASGTAAATAAAENLSAAPDAAATYRYLPTSTRFPSGLDTTTVVTPPAPGKGTHAKTHDKSNHLPVKPVSGGKVKVKVQSGNYNLISLDKR
jgi:hypothetical protein